MWLLTVSSGKPKVELACNFVIRKPGTHEKSGIRYEEEGMSLEHGELTSKVIAAAIAAHRRLDLWALGINRKGVQIAVGLCQVQERG